MFKLLLISLLGNKVIDSFCCLPIATTYRQKKRFFNNNNNTHVTQADENGESKKRGEEKKNRAFNDRNLIGSPDLYFCRNKLSIVRRKREHTHPS